MTGKHIYLGGPMRTKHLYNAAMFLRVARYLRAMGAYVVSPWEHDVETGMDPSRSLASQGFDMGAAFAWDFSEILKADAVVFLPGWEMSKGVAAELVVAVHAGKPVFEWTRDGRLVPIKREPARMRLTWEV